MAARFPGEIHMLLTDMVMPGTSGRELAERISARRQGIRVLFMSGYTDNVITSGGKLGECVAFLQKPFSPGAPGQERRPWRFQTPPGFLFLSHCLQTN